jgi:hypothetical protein
MDWAMKRRVIYAVSIGLALVLIIGTVSFIALRKPPTCFDGTRNQGELGIDCGGPCVLLCKMSTRDPVVIWQRAFRIQQGIYTAAAYIENPNPTAEVISLPYTFILYDGNNIPIAERKGKTYVPPGKKFIVFESAIKTGDHIPARALITFGTDYSWLSQTRKPAEIETRSPVISGENISPVLDAELYNPGFTPVDRIEATAVVYDRNDNAVGVSRTFVDTITEQSSEKIIFTWPEPFDKPSSRIEIITINQ